MFGLLLKKQWKVQLFLIIFFCAVFFVNNKVEIQFEERYLQAQTRYLAESDLSDPEAFFEKMEEDRQQAVQVVSCIENYEDYEGYDEVLANAEIDPMLLLVGSSSYATYEMIVWRENMLNTPGKYADSIRDDEYMFSQLSGRLHNQSKLSDHIENLKEIAKRGMRRSSSLYPVYEKTLKHLEQVDVSQNVTETIRADRFLRYVESDFYIYILVFLGVFATFSGLKQNRISQVIAISKMGTKQYVRRQLAVSLTTVIGGVVIYDVLVFALFGAYRFREVWKLPIQALGDHEMICLCLNAAQYALLVLFMKLLFCILFAMVSSVISIISNNTYTAALLHCAVVGIWYVLMRGGFVGEVQSALFGGGGKVLLSDFPFFSLGNLAVSYVFVYCVFLLLLTFVTFGTAVWISKWKMKR